ncbi:MAG TPA: caspase family protein [Actinospica sp.]|jgi:signal transduction histidine kinase|nr:caspase family protein [Actinospica sp.]
MALIRDLSRSRAILIGNAAFDDPGIPDLPAALACVEALNRLLTSDLCGWPTDRVAELRDIPAPHKLAYEVSELVRDVEDVLLVYYVGHGIRTSEGQLALAVRETKPDPDLLRNGALLYENLATLLRGCRARTKLVILDCCHAELGTRATYAFQSADLAEAYPVDGLYFIGASGRDKKAKAPVDAAAGTLTYFTAALIDVVRQGIPIPSPTLRLDQIFVELRGRLLRAQLPEPVEAGTRGAHHFPLAFNVKAGMHEHGQPLQPSEGNTGRRRALFGSVPRAEAERLRAARALAESTLREALISASLYMENLADQQLALLDAAQRAETDVSVLEHLYRIDNLAVRAKTRSAAVLTLLGQHKEPEMDRELRLVDLVRTSVAQVQGYQRVMLRATGTPDMIPPRIQHDLILLITELVRNAITFSPLTSSVDIEVVEGGQVTITDHGSGFNPVLLAVANRQFETPVPLETALASPSLGLHIIAHLARRHHLTVRFEGNTPGTGVTAVIQAIPSA